MKKFYQDSSVEIEAEIVRERATQTLILIRERRQKEMKVLFQDYRDDHQRKHWWEFWRTPNLTDAKLQVLFDEGDGSMGWYWHYEYMDVLRFGQEEADVCLRLLRTIELFGDHPDCYMVNLTARDGYAISGYLP